MLATPELIEEASQRCRLAELLPRWLREVPLYRGTGAVSVRNGAEQGGRDCSLAVLREMPLLTKRDIRRDFPQNFLGKKAELEKLIEEDVVELEHTAGTSEERTPLLLPRGWWAEQERRALGLNPLVARVLEQNPEARRVTISSPVCNSEVCYTGTPSHRDRIVGPTLMVNLARYPFLWSEAELDRMAAETVEWGPEFLDVDPVYGAWFALYCERRGIRVPTLKFVISSYEYLSVVHRRILRRAFGVPVFNLYGSTETGHLLMETEEGDMRPSYGTAFLTVLNEDKQGIGDLVVSTLSNDVMPLLHYSIGDLVERHENPLGTRYRTHGRASDAFHTPAGQRVTIRQVDECFAESKGIAHYQLVEGKVGWRLRYVPEGQGPGAETLREVEERLSQRLDLRGGLEIEATDILLPENSGKFRLGYPAKR